MRGDGVRGFLGCQGICLNAIAANPRDRSGDADRGGSTPTLIQNRGGDAARAHIRLLIVDRKSTRLNSSHGYISYAVFCLKKKKPYGSISSVSLLATDCT